MFLFYESLPARITMYLVCVMPMESRRGATIPFEMEMQSVVKHHVGAEN